MDDSAIRTKFLLDAAGPSLGASGGAPASALSDGSRHDNAGHLAWRSGNLERAAIAVRIGIEAASEGPSDRSQLAKRP